MSAPPNARWSIDLVYDQRRLRSTVPHPERYRRVTKECLAAVAGFDACGLLEYGPILNELARYIERRSIGAATPPANT